MNETGKDTTRVAARSAEASWSPPSAAKQSANVGQTEIYRGEPGPRRHRERDLGERLLVDAFNDLDRAAHRVERLLAEMVDQPCDRARAHGEVLVAEAHRMVDGCSGDLQQIRNQIGELHRVHRRIRPATPRPGGDDHGLAPRQASHSAN